MRTACGRAHCHQPFRAMSDQGIVLIPFGRCRFFRHTLPRQAIRACPAGIPGLNLPHETRILHCPRSSSRLVPSASRRGGGRNYQENLLRFKGQGGRQIRLPGRHLEEKLCARQQGSIPGLPPGIRAFGICLFACHLPGLSSGFAFPQRLSPGLAGLLRLSHGNTAHWHTQQLALRVTAMCLPPALTLNAGIAFSYWKSFRLATRVAPWT